MAENSTVDGGAGVGCVTNCDRHSSACFFACVFPDRVLSPPPPPSHSSKPVSQSHVAPFLIATVCILGVSFLLLTTCTIILRLRFSSRRRNSAAGDGGSPAVDEEGLIVAHPIWHITTVGLNQSAIDSITAFKYKKLDGLLTDGCDCSVCLTEFGDGDELRLLPKCGHAFHVSCIDTWLRSHNKCPLCRAPVVNDHSNGVGRDASVGVRVPSLRVLDSGEGAGMGNSGREIRGPAVEGGEERERGGGFVELPIEGVRIAEFLKKNRELRILSDLGENYRSRKEGEGADPIRRSISFNSSVALEVYRAMGNVCAVGDEGCSSNGEKKKGREVEKGVKRGSSMSGLSTKSSSIDRSLQKGPVSMKRSVSSSSKFFSFRRSKSQASVLPL